LKTANLKIYIFSYAVTSAAAPAVGLANNLRILTSMLAETCHPSLHPQSMEVEGILMEYKVDLGQSTKPTCK